MQARVYVTLKPEVLDPQGEAVTKGLISLGVAGVRAARVGKLVELDVDGDRAEVLRALDEAGRKLLANPVIEDFRVELDG